MLPVISLFHSIQGEGFNTGREAFFVRLSGCDIACHWCDTKESWDKSSGIETEETKIVESIISSGSKLAVITGGEPSQYNLKMLVTLLQKNDIQVAIETAGCYEIDAPFDWLCLSPKKNKPPLEQNLKAAHELKVVVYNRDDIHWAVKNAEKVSDSCHLFLQPEWGVKEKVMPLIAAFILANPCWKISHQTHKYMGVE